MKLFQFLVPTSPERQAAAWQAFALSLVGGYTTAPSLVEGAWAVGMEAARGTFLPHLVACSDAQAVCIAERIKALFGHQKAMYWVVSQDVRFV